MYVVQQTVNTVSARHERVPLLSFAGNVCPFNTKMSRISDDIELDGPVRIEPGQVRNYNYGRAREAMGTGKEQDLSEFRTSIIPHAKGVESG